MDLACMCVCDVSGGMTDDFRLYDPTRIQLRPVREHRLHGGSLGRSTSPRSHFTWFTSDLSDHVYISSNTNSTGRYLGCTALGACLIAAPVLEAALGVVGAVKGTRHGRYKGNRVNERTRMTTRFSIIPSERCLMGRTPLPRARGVLEIDAHVRR